MKRDYPCSNMSEKLCALRPQPQVRDKPTEIQCAWGILMAKLHRNLSSSFGKTNSPNTTRVGSKWIRRIQTLSDSWCWTVCVCAQPKLSPKVTSPNHDGSLGPITYQVRKSRLADSPCEIGRMYDCVAVLYTCTIYIYIHVHVCVCLHAISIYSMYV